MILSLIGYDPAGVWNKTMTSVDELIAWKNPAGMTWINVEILDRPDEINRLAEVFGIHPLTVEDILDHTHQRPKVEEFDTYLFIAFKKVGSSGSFSSPIQAEVPAAHTPRHQLTLMGGAVDLEHISMVITKDTVLTFQGKPGDCFDGIRKRIMNNAGRIRRMGPDYLAYALMDAVVDEYFVSIDSLGSEIEDFEDRVLDEKDDTFIRDIQDVKHKLLKMRRAVWPLRESLSLLMRFETKLMGSDLEPFLQDLYEHVIQAAETVETYRELIAGIMEINMTASSNRLGKVMKVLTIISTIFIPLTFIAGVYGMNFDFMPELYYTPSYFIVLGGMAIIAIGMLLYFKRKKWI
jgi:magnesium transporter